MNALRLTCILIGGSQLVLGAAFLFWPAGFMALTGFAPPAAGSAYLLAMFAARLIVYGLGMFVIARDPASNRLWLDGMLAIQAIDLAAGLAYTATGAVPLAVAAFPMVNAAVFAGLLVAFRGRAVVRAA